MNSPRFWALIVVSILVLTSGMAWADAGYWRVSGTVINTRNTPFGMQSCPKAGLKLRFKSRWANGQGCAVGFNGECPWGSSWGTDTTDSQGRFSEKSYHFANTSKMRDILIQYRDYQNNSWRTLKVIHSISGATPHTKSGNVSNFNLGTIYTSIWECPSNVGSSGSGSGSGPGAPQTGPKPQPPMQNSPQASQVCGRMVPGGGIQRADLTIASADVMHRINQPQAPPERISWQVVIRNNGPAPYYNSGKCRTVVRAVFAIKDMSVDRAYELPIPSLGTGQSVTLTGSGNLGEISDSSSANYPVQFTVDPENNLPEANEGNNGLSGCYNLNSGNFSLGDCP